MYIEGSGFIRFLEFFFPIILPKKHTFLLFNDIFSAKIFGYSKNIITFAPKLIIVKQ